MIENNEEYKNIYDCSASKYPKVNGYNDKEFGRVIGWISGGIASAIACKYAIAKYGDNVELIFCNTNLENSDTFRFIGELSDYFNREIKVIESDRFHEPEDVWHKYNGLNFAHGAPCSMSLKRDVRVKEQNLKEDFAHVFGFDYGKKEIKRANGMLEHHPEINAIFPLIVNKIDRQGLFYELEEMGIKPPATYEFFENNNCIGEFDSEKGGCVQGGVGYWQEIERLFPKKFKYMANIEHELSIKNGKPITICKDQRKGKEGDRLFLKECSSFKDILTIKEIKGKRPNTSFECNGFCSPNIFTDF